MATYPIKMLRDEDRQPFVPFTNAAATVDKNNESLQELMDNGKYKIVNNVTTSSAGKGVLDAYQGKVLNDKFSNYIPLAQKGVANGVATLDDGGKVLGSQLPSYVDDVIESYIINGSTALSSGWLSTTDGGTALTPERGKIYLIMTAGQYQNKQYRWGGSVFVLCNPSDVNSVNGMTGIVTLKQLTIQANGTQIGSTYNGTTDEVINITIPTNNNQLTNGAGYITSSDSITGNAATATTADRTKAALTIQKNGTTIDSSFDGSIARTINIIVPTKVTDLTDNTNYVKKTDYASTTNAGVVKLGTGLAVKDGVVSVTGSATADSVEWSAVKNAPTKVSYWENDAGYITSYTETDPTVPAWAKATNKPIYTASEVGALPDTTVVPTKTSQLTNDSSFATTTYVDNAIATSVPDLPENVVTSVNNSGTDQVRIVVSETKPAATTGYVDLWVNPNASSSEDILNKIADLESTIAALEARIKTLEDNEITFVQTGTM